MTATYSENIPAGYRYTWGVFKGYPNDISAENAIELSDDFKALSEKYKGQKVLFARTLIKKEE